MLEDGTLVQAGPASVKGDSLTALIRRRRAEEMEKAAAGDYEADKARKMAADADLAEIQAAKAAGKLVETKTIRRRWEGAVVACRTKLLTIPDRVAPKVIVAPSLDAAKKMLAEEIGDALESLTEIKHQPDELPEEDLDEETESEAEETDEAED